MTHPHRCEIRLAAADQGWISFDIKESFLDRGDTNGFWQLIQRMIHGGCRRVHHLERYRHRLSIEGRPLHYYAVVGRSGSGTQES